MRTLLLIALLILATSPTAAQPAPDAVAPAPLAVRASVSRTAGLSVAWTPPQGQQFACVFYASGHLLGCERGGAGRLIDRPGGDVGLQPGIGPWLVRSYGAGGRVLAEGQSYRVVLPVVYKGPRR